MTGIRTVTGDISDFTGFAYMHEHLVIDSPLIDVMFPHISLPDVDAAVAEVGACRAAGAGLMVDAMPAAAGRGIAKLIDVATRTGMRIVAATGLHHDRYYGPRHWSNHVSVDDLAALFVADLTEGIDEFDYTGPLVRRSPGRAGLLKVATSGERPDTRDIRNMAAVAQASLRTGAPVMTHCEGGWGGLAQVEHLLGHGLEPGSIILSHVDKAHDAGYLHELAATGVFLELDQALREKDKGADSVTVSSVLDLIDAGFAAQIVLGTDGARRTLWQTLGGTPGLAWLASGFVPELAAAGVDPGVIPVLTHDNPLRALTWRPLG